MRTGSSLLLGRIEHGILSWLGHREETLFLGPLVWPKGGALGDHTPCRSHRSRAGWTKVVPGARFNMVSGSPPPRPSEAHMTGPAKNRLHDYEAGWLTLLVEMGVATKQEAHDAMCRVAQAAIDENEARSEKREERKRRKK